MIGYKKKGSKQSLVASGSIALVLLLSAALMGGASRKPALAMAMRKPNS